MPTKGKMQDAPIILISNGYENIYERGFCNGVADFGFDACLISSDATDYKGLRPGLRTLNLRGSQDERRPKWRKVLNLLQYHGKLMCHVAMHRNSIVHVIGLIEPPVLCGLVQGVWSRFWSKRYIVTVHDLAPHDRETDWNKRMYRWSYGLADMLVVHTAKMKHDLVSQYRLKAEQIHVMEHGIEPIGRAGERVPPSALERQSAGDSPVKLLFFGKVMRYKGLDLLLQALETVPWPFELVIAGKCRDGELTEELRKQIQAHPHSASIRWENEYVQEEQLPELFGRANALVLPYRKIDQSGVLFQALRYGLPIVATQVGTFPDYVKADVGELATAGDAPAFRAALMRFEARRSQLDRSAIASFGASFEWQRTVRALEPVYASTPEPASP